MSLTAICKSKSMIATKAFFAMLLCIAVPGAIMTLAPFLQGMPENWKFLALPAVIMPIIPLTSIFLFVGGVYIFLVSKEEKTTKLGHCFMFFTPRVLLCAFILILPAYIVSIGSLIIRN